MDFVFESSQHYCLDKQKWNTSYSGQNNKLLMSDIMLAAMKDENGEGQMQETA